MITLSQRDPRWSNHILKGSTATVGKYGCLITSLSMITEECGYYQSPTWMADNLTYTKDGRLFWDSMDDDTCLTFKYRYYGNNPDHIKEVIENPKQAVVIEVEGRHWVWGVGLASGGGFKIHDPWFGDASTTRRYKKITGYTVMDIDRKQIEEPSWIKKITKPVKRILHELPFPTWFII